MNKVKRIEDLSNILIESRMIKNKSQRWMAKQLSKSPTTISNWEEGISVPDIIDVLSWFDVLGINPTQYMIRFLDPDTYGSVTKDIKNDEKNKELLIDFINNIATPSIREKLVFNFLGDTGSYFESQLEMMTAHNLCQLDIKVSNAWTIYHNYIMAKNRHELMKSDVIPDEEKLQAAIEKGQEAAFSGKDGYVFSLDKR